MVRRTKDTERKRKARPPHRTGRRLGGRGIIRSILRAIIVVVSCSILHSRRPRSEADGKFRSTARKLKCDGARPTCTNCSRRPPPSSKTSPSPRSSPPECKFDPYPRRRGPAKHKQLKLDAESESSWSLLRAVPRTRARAAAEAKIVTQPLRVSAGRSASTGGSESSFAGGSVAHPSATSILFGGEVAILATPAASSTRESTPAADEQENEQIEEPCVPKEKREEEDEKHEEEERPRAENGEKREEKPKEEEDERGSLINKSPKKEEKEARIKMDGEEGKVVMLKEATLESSPSYHLLGHHT